MPESTLISQLNRQNSSIELTLATSKVIADTVRQFIDHPDRIATTIHTDGRTVTLVLNVAPDDIGKVIGRGGANRTVAPHYSRCDPQQDRRELRTGHPGGAHLNAHAAVFRPRQTANRSGGL